MAEARNLKELEARLDSQRDQIANRKREIQDLDRRVAWLEGAVEDLRTRVGGGDRPVVPDRPDPDEPDEPTPPGPPQPEEPEVLAEGTYSPTEEHQHEVLGPWEVGEGLCFEVELEASAEVLREGIHVLAWITPDLRRQTNEAAYLVIRQGGREVKLSRGKKPDGSGALNIEKWQRSPGGVYHAAVEAYSSGGVMVMVDGDGWISFEMPTPVRPLFLWLSAPRHEGMPEEPSIGGRFNYRISRLAS